MREFSGRLFGGRLFAGKLFRGELVEIPPEVIPPSGGGGGGTSRRPGRIHSQRQVGQLAHAVPAAVLRQDDEEVLAIVMASLAAGIEAAPEDDLVVLEVIQRLLH